MSPGNVAVPILEILEILFVQKCDLFISKNKLLSEHQHGFRKNRTTTHALMEMMERITKAVDDAEYFIGIYIALQKSVDTIDHSKL